MTILPSAEMKGLYRYIWKVSGRQQVVLSILAAAVFLIELVPLELQRRIVNDAVGKQDFKLILMLCLAYVAIEVAHGGLKLGLNLYRSKVGEAAIRRLRMHALGIGNGAEGGAGEHNAAQKSAANHEGVAISIIVSEVETVGGFIASSYSVPMLNAGILLSVLGYMLYTQPWLALVAVLLFFPQVLFIPLLQAAINRRTEKRITVLREFSVDIVDGAVGGKRAWDEDKFRRRVQRLYELNMQIYRRKFGMNFLMNLMYHLGVIGILAVGSWLLLEGKTEVGTIVAFISGLSRMNDPWGDLVDFFRDMSNAGVRFRLLMSGLGEKVP